MVRYRETVAEVDAELARVDQAISALTTLMEPMTLPERLVAIPELVALGSQRAHLMIERSLLQAPVPPRTPFETGDCCMARHAQATPPWTCDCPCHEEAK